MSDPGDDPSDVEDRSEVHLRLEHWLSIVLGPLSLKSEAFTERGGAILEALEGLTGNDILWVLAAVLGGILADAPPERQRRLMVAFHALTDHSTEQSMRMKAAHRHHEEGHA
jgi:hypothetical protein